MIEAIFQLIGSILNFIFWATAVLFGFMVIFIILWFIDVIYLLTT